MFIIILIPGWNSCAWIQCVGKVPLKMKLDTVSRISFQQPESVIVKSAMLKICAYHACIIPAALSWLKLC